MAPLFNEADAVLVGSAAADAVYVGSTEVWSAGPSIPGVNIGDPFMGGYLAGFIDTTKGNVIAADASQAGLLYALIVAPKSLENGSLSWSTLPREPAPSATRTRWDGLAATVAMASATFPAANYCYGLAHPSDGASRWYLPAMDELELTYRNLKATSENNYVAPRDAGDFPGTTPGIGENLSTGGPAYTSSNPAQTSIAAFQVGGAQALGAAGTALTFWTSTDAVTGDPFTSGSARTQRMSGSFCGLQGYSGKSNSLRIRPVRRFLL